MAFFQADHPMPSAHFRPAGLLVQMRGDGTLAREESMMAVVAESIGIPVAVASEKQVERAKAVVTADIVPVGSVPFVRSALRQLGHSLPLHTPYPAALQDLLYRTVERLPALRDAKAILRNGRRVFTKPAGWKRFTGFVAEFEDDIRFNGASGSQAVWVSTPVTFVSEWRGYVVDGKLLELRFADHGGDRAAVPDLQVITDALTRIGTGPEIPAGYVIDFGVLDTGATALIEMNDGFSFGAYDGVSPETYWAVTVSRWRQLATAPAEVE
jgi:hypothetical protein